MVLAEGLFLATQVRYARTRESQDADPVAVQFVTWPVRSKVQGPNVQKTQSKRLKFQL